MINLNIQMRIILFLLIALFGAACTQPKSENLNLQPDFADFEAFYHQFHRDSAYQIAHITFPMQGVPDNVANKPDYDENFRWTAENWTLNIPIDLEKTGFQREIQTIGEGLIIEKLYDSTGSYGMERRFSKTGNEWMLIYYQGINPR